MNCKGCGSPLTAFEYQARSADEAHSTSYKCPQCPLSVDKFYNSQLSPHIYLTKATKKAARTPQTEFHSYTQKRFLSVYTKDIQNWISYTRQQAHAQNFLDHDSNLFKVYSSGPWTNYSMRKIESENISFNASLVLYTCAVSKEDTNRVYVDFEYFIFDDWFAISKESSIIFMKDVSGFNDADILDSLYEIYLNGLCPQSLSDYIDRVSLGSLSNLTARAYDSNTTDDSSYIYSTKPDGERMWMVRNGSVWFYVRRLLGFKIEAFELDSRITYTTNKSIGPVLDVELMINHSPILIDILADENLKLAPYDRNIEWITNEFKRLKSYLLYLNTIHVRSFFSTFDAAEQYSKNVTYPIDGIVAVSKQGTDMKKLKQLRSIELRFEEESILVSKEGNKLFQMQSSNAYAIGDIIEIRFGIIDEKIHIYDSFIRPDKTVANDNAAIDSIISSSINTIPQSMIRTSIWRWSNKLRNLLYKRAYSLNTKRSIILDIGSGSGQSSEAFRDLPDCSFILVEPDEMKCKSLCKRLSVRQYYKDPRSVIPYIPNLKTGSRRYHILNTTLDNILKDPPTLKNISHVVKCAIACFSAHYIYQSIEDLHNANIPFIGCYYSYDDIDIGDSIIDTKDIFMKKISEQTALVKWGKDAIYEEPVLRYEDIPLDVSCIDAVKMVDVLQFNKEHEIVNTCSHVKVLMLS